MSYCDRAIDVMLRCELIEDPSLRIEEVEGLLKVNHLSHHRILAVIDEVINGASDTVVNEAVLQVTEDVEPSCYLIVRLDEARKVGLVCLVLVVSVIGLHEIRVGRDGDTLSVVQAYIVVAR